MENKPDYILVLGGAKLSNFERPKKAKKIFDMVNKNAIVVGLTCDRKINEVEYDSYKEYNGLIQTEEDAVIGTFSKIKGLLAISSTCFFKLSSSIENSSKVVSILIFAFLFPKPSLNVKKSLS